MKKSHFANPHGLINDKNISSVEDLSKLCKAAWKNPEFKKKTSI